MNTKPAPAPALTGTGSEKPPVTHLTHNCRVEPITTRCGIVSKGTIVPPEVVKTRPLCVVCQDLAGGPCARCGWEGRG